MQEEKKNSMLNIMDKTLHPPRQKKKRKNLPVTILLNLIY